jgi:cupin fold WbuC family metalloprotein
LQVAYLNMKSEQTFKAHRHIPRPRAIEKTQETWIVVRGSVTVIYYDLDDSLLGQRTLSPGDLTITLEGGHNYIAHSESTLVVEAKTGPFVGVDADKVPLSA